MIPIRNVYYMLSYAFKILNKQGYKKVATEKFKNYADLCSAILINGTSSLIKKGLAREYVLKTETTAAVKGKIDISSSIKEQSMIKRRLVCEYDEFSENSYMNRIIKTTMLKLLHADIAPERKNKLRKLLMYFANVDVLDVNLINWNVRIDRNNQEYRMLISICNLIINGLLQTQSDGKVKMMDFLDEQRMCRLYEKFLLEYYRKEHPELTANASQIAWQLDDTENQMLPRMQTDIMLSKNNNILIIDAKYYSHMTQQQYGIHTLHSNNLYQIFTYVKNKEFELRNYEHTVSGMLLYAQTDEDIIPNNTYHMSGNQISVLALDLNQDFPKISRTLDDIAKNFL